MPLLLYTNTTAFKYRCIILISRNYTFSQMSCKMFITIPCFYHIIKPNYPISITNQNIFFEPRALFVSLPATILLVTLVCIVGVVIYATYHTCDPFLDGKLISRDQVCIVGVVIYATYYTCDPFLDGKLISRDQVCIVGVVIYATHHTYDSYPGIRYV